MNITSRSTSQQIVILLVLLAALFLISVAPVAAVDDLVQPDGRVNQVAHFGGDALYCVDRDFVPTHQYSDFGQGGFRLLDIDGQELWFVPALQISAAVAEAKATGKGVLVGEGRGSYGPTSIYTYVTSDGDDYFIFSGYDEFSKLNSLTFKFCIPVGPIPHPPGTGDDEDLCTWFPFPQKLFVGKIFSPPLGNGGTPRPCDECPNNPDNLVDDKRVYRASVGPRNNINVGYCDEYPNI